MTSVDLFVGKRIRQRRIACGVQQADLARDLGADTSRIHDYETGRVRISASHLFAIARRLGITVDAFYEGIGQSGPRAATGAVVTGPAESQNRLQPYFDTLSPDRQKTIRAMARAMLDLPHSAPFAALPALSDPGKPAQDMQEGSCGSD